MSVIVTLFGIAIAALGILGLIRPGSLIRLVSVAWQTRAGLYLAIILRLVLGAALIGAASRSRFPGRAGHTWHHFHSRRARRFQSGIRAPARIRPVVDRAVVGVHPGLGVGRSRVRCIPGVRSFVGRRISAQSVAAVVHLRVRRRESWAEAEAARVTIQASVYTATVDAPGQRLASGLLGETTSPSV